MRCGLFVILALTVGCESKPVSVPYPTPKDPNARQRSITPEEPPEEKLHSEKGIASTIEIERRDPHYHRLLIGGTLWGTQVNSDYKRHWADDTTFIVPGSPWDSILAVGANAVYDPRLEPLSYFHRTGPVGAIFRELHTRQSGREAISPVAVLGLGDGSASAHAQKGQHFTYYETDPALKRLIADTDKFFTYISDARKRGVEIEIRIGNRRENLKEDKSRKYALILVDQGESFPVAKDVFTKEAVQLYFDRLTDDGIVALHVSNKYLYLEPMFARLAEELKLSGRVWNDQAERGRPGKNASSWVVLAKDEKTLGSLALPEQVQLEQSKTKFKPLINIAGIPVWTDAHAEVFMILFGAEKHRTLSHFGLQVPYGGKRPWE